MVLLRLVDLLLRLSTLSRVLLPLVLCVVSLLGHSYYNRYRHPLHYFPGPFWGSVTDFYQTYLFSTRNSHERIDSLHKKYGSVIRLAPNLLSFTDTSLLPTVYHRTAEKTPFYSTGLAGEVAPLLQIQSHSQHAAKLKALAPTYSMKNMKLLENSIDECICMVIEALKSRYVLTGAKVDLSEWTRWYVYDTITYLIYGEPAGFVAREKDVDGLIKAWHHTFRLGGLIATLPWLVHPLITSWPLKRFAMPRKGHERGSGAAMSSHERFFQHRLRNPQLAKPGNIFDNFRHTRNPDGSKFGLEQTERECFLLTVASQDTTAALISPLISYIAQDKSIHSKLIAEISMFEKQGRLSSPVARYEESVSMPYFMACVRETLRIRPPTPIILPRYVPNGGMVIDGFWVPDTVEIGANPHLIHRNQEIFGNDVDAFRPERWLNSPEETRLMDKFDFAWGYGSRKCVGKNIALMDGLKFVLQLFRDFEIRSLTPQQPWRTENWGINVYFGQWVYLEGKASRKDQSPRP